MATVKKSTSKSATAPEKSVAKEKSTLKTPRKTAIKSSIKPSSKQEVPEVKSRTKTLKVAAAKAIKRPATTTKSPATSRKKNPAFPADDDPKFLRADNLLDDDLAAHKFDTPDLDTTPFPIEEELGELPESYGTRRLYLAARDPYWVFAYWDLSREQFHQEASKSHDGKIFLRIYEQSGHQLSQTQIYEGSRNHYFHAQRPNTTFFAELGYYRQGDHVFEVISRSGHTTSPRDNVSPNTHARFATIPMHFTFRQLLEMIKDMIAQDEELAEAIARLQEMGYPLPFKANVRTGQWTTEQEQALISVLGGDLMRRVWMGSFELTEWVRRRLLSETSSGLNLSSWSSPAGASDMSGQRSFWMNVNAELIIYGATDPNARLRIAGKDIDIRKDGTFSFHWSFPDGDFHIPVEATSPDNVETRGALLSFLRRTAISGEVSAHPQDPNLDTPITT